MAAAAWSRACGFVAAKSLPCAASPSRSWIREDVLQRRELVGNRLDLGELRRVLADDRDRFGVREEVADVTR